MRTIGPIIIHWRRKNKKGVREMPWDVLEKVNLSEEVRMVIAKVARSAAKDFLQDTTDNYQPQNMVRQIQDHRSELDTLRTQVEEHDALLHYADDEEPGEG